MTPNVKNAFNVSTLLWSSLLNFPFSCGTEHNGNNIREKTKRNLIRFQIYRSKLLQHHMYWCSLTKMIFNVNITIDQKRILKKLKIYIVFLFPWVPLMKIWKFTHLWNISVVYGHSPISICGGGATGSDSEVTWPEATMTGRMLCACANGSFTKTH